MTTIAKYIFYYYLFILVFIRYFLRTPPFLVLNNIYFILIFLFAPALLYLSVYSFKHFSNWKSLKKYSLFYFLILFSFFIPAVIGLARSNQLNDIVFDFFPIIFTLPFFALITLWKKDTDILKETFVLLLLFAIILSFTYLREFISGFYILFKNNQLNLNSADKLWWKLKDDNRYLISVTIISVLSFSVYINAKISKEKRWQLLFISLFFVFIHVIFYGRSQLITLILVSGILFFLNLTSKLWKKYWQQSRILIISLLFLGIVISLYDPIGRAIHNKGIKNSMSIRFNERQEMLKDLNSNYLSGNGLGSKFPYVQFKVKKNRYLRKSHNSFLNYFYKGGILQFLFFAFLYIFIIVKSFRGYLFSLDNHRATIYLYLFAFFLFHFVRGSQDHVFYGNEQIAILIIHLALYYFIKDVPDEEEEILLA